MKYRQITCCVIHIELHAESLYAPSNAEGADLRQGLLSSLFSPKSFDWITVIRVVATHAVIES